MLLISTAAASAFEMNCDAPRTYLGEDRSANPVAKIDIKYSPDDHAWRVFHYLRDGLVVSRSEQYAIMDASNDRRTQWQGSLNRQRNLYMIGEVRRVEDGILYLEWMYDRSKNNALVMHAAARCAMASPSLPQPTSQAPTQPHAQAPAQAVAGSSTQISNLPDRALCVNALNRERTAWDRSSIFTKDVAEATKRGLTVDTCRELAATYSAPTFNPSASTGSKSQDRTGPAGLNSNQDYKSNL